MFRGGYFYNFFAGFLFPKLLRHRKLLGITKTQFSKGKLKVWIVVFVCILFLTIAYFFKYPVSSKPQKMKKIKRDLEAEYDYEQQLKTQKIDIELVPENRRSIQHYPNHRYADDSFLRLENGANNSNSKRLTPKTNLSNIQDIILKSKMTKPKRTGQTKFLDEMLKGLGSSMRLKGVYTQSGSKKGFLKNQFDEKYTYSKEINNLMHKDLGKGGNKGKSFPEKALKIGGAPFRLPPNGRGSSKRVNSNLKREHRLNLHPITIYLDFYPTDSENVNRNKANLGASDSTQTSPDSTKFSTLESKDTAKTGIFVTPPKKQNGIIMKLNLYPNEPSFPKRGFTRQAGSPRLKYNQKAERKSFGWFSKKKEKKKHPKECSFVGLNPHGKHITAKWKNEKGEWVHADHVTVKYLKKGD